jgi:hypothetical protein
MIRITGDRLLGASSGGQLLDLHPFVDNQCRAATSHLQHQVEIPNSWRGKVAHIANLGVRAQPNILEINRFPNWHGSCSVQGTSFCQLE